MLNISIKRLTDLNLLGCVNIIRKLILILDIGMNTAVGYSRPKRTKKGANQEDLINEINEMKKSNRRDLDEIKRLKSEQLKVEK